MNYYQKLAATLAGHKPALLLILGFFTLSCMAVDNASFTGEWKLNEAKSGIKDFPVCILGEGDRIRSKTMNIADKEAFLLIVSTSSTSEGAPITRQEKLTFDGKESETTIVGWPREMSTAKLSTDGQTMTVHFSKSFKDTGEKADFKVTEVWKLINGGKSISIHVISKETDNERAMTLVYDKAS
jgi:hypothetical protein